MTCRLPPPGWTCSRDAGHDGPCAAAPDVDEASWQTHVAAAVCAAFGIVMVYVDPVAGSCLGGLFLTGAIAAELATLFLWLDRRKR